MPLACPVPSCVRDARIYAREVCATEDVGGDRRDTMVLAISELVANALTHGQPPVCYDIRADDDALLLTVTDGDPALPSDSAGSGVDAEGGRGLMLIDAMARDWGWRPTGTGKQVWARV